MFLYERNCSASGLSLIPKLKYEHLHLTSFSKMRVDLAAQVFVTFNGNVSKYIFLMKVFSGSVAKGIGVSQDWSFSRRRKRKKRLSLWIFLTSFFDCSNVSCFNAGKFSRNCFKFSISIREGFSFEGTYIQIAGY